MNNSSSQSWTTFYRPKTLSDLHLKSVQAQLINFQRSGFFPRALLMAGPKGTGKTTTARIIGAILNEPSNEKIVRSTYFGLTNNKPKPLNDPIITHELTNKIIAGQAYVVQELDAASNRGIQEIRDLKEKAMLAPIEGIVSVFILDEVHMLTTPAFNALLKLLEDPPNHTVFILATTELNKLPDTIKSRCQIIPFYKATLSEMSEALEKVIEAEKIKIDTDSIALLSKYADGSFRDAVKYLQLVSQSQPVTVDIVSSLIQPSFETTVNQFIQALLDKKSQEIISLFAELRNSGSNPEHFFKALLESLHHSLVSLLTNSKATDISPMLNTKIVIFLLKEFLAINHVKPAMIPFLDLEVLALDIINRSQKTSAGPNQSEPLIENSKFQQVNTKSKVVAETSGLNPSTKQCKQPTKTSQDITIGNASFLIEKWTDFINEVASQNSSLATLIRSSSPSIISTNGIRISVFYRFHQEQLESPKSMRLINEIITKICQGNIELNIVLSSPPEEAELIDKASITDTDTFTNQVMVALN